MTKQISTLFLLAFAPVILAKSTTTNEKDKVARFNPATGFAALNFSNKDDTVSAESMGLYSMPAAVKLQTVDKRLQLTPWVHIKAATNDAIQILETTTASSFELHDYQKIKSVNALFSFGKFKTVAELKSNEENMLSSNSISITGYYNLYSKNSFTLSLKANMNTLNAHELEQYYQTTDYKRSNSDIFSSQATNHSFGIIGTFELSPNWRASGELVTTNFDQQVGLSPFIQKDSAHMAQFKTSYSF